MGLLEVGRRTLLEDGRMGLLEDFLDFMVCGGLDVPAILGVDGIVHGTGGEEVSTGLQKALGRLLRHPRSDTELDALLCGDGEIVGRPETRALHTEMRPRRKCRIHADWLITPSRRAVRARTGP